MKPCRQTSVRRPTVLARGARTGHAWRVAAKLYVILGSHACRTGMLLLEHKGIPYRTVTIPTGGQRSLPLAGSPRGTVPALVMDGRKIQSNVVLAGALDEMQPDPPLFPADDARRREVEEAERWG